MSYWGVVDRIGKFEVMYCFKVSVIRVKEGNCSFSLTHFRLLNTIFRFRCLDLVQKNHERYDALSTSEKRAVVKDIMHKIHRTGRFLKKKNDIWVIISDKDVCLKIAHAIQYHVREKKLPEKQIPTATDNVKNGSLLDFVAKEQKNKVRDVDGLTIQKITDDSIVCRNETSSPIHNDESAALIDFDIIEQLQKEQAFISSYLTRLVTPPAINSHDVHPYRAQTHEKLSNNAHRTDMGYVENSVNSISHQDHSNTNIFRPDTFSDRAMVDGCISLPGVVPHLQAVPQQSEELVYVSSQNLNRTLDLTRHNALSDTYYDIDNNKYRELQYTSSHCSGYETHPSNLELCSTNRIKNDLLHLCHCSLGVQSVAADRNATLNSDQLSSILNHNRIHANHPSYYTFGGPYSARFVGVASDKNEARRFEQLRYIPISEVNDMHHPINLELCCHCTKALHGLTACNNSRQQQFDQSLSVRSHIDRNYNHPSKIVPRCPFSQRLDGITSYEAVRQLSEHHPGHDFNHSFCKSFRDVSTGNGVTQKSTQLESVSDNNEKCKFNPSKFAFYHPS
jgi:hypothetical protein